MSEERNRGGAKIAQLLKNTIYKIYRANQATGPRRSSDFAEEIEKLNGMIRFRVLTFSFFFFFFSLQRYTGKLLSRSFFKWNFRIFYQPYDAFFDSSMRCTPFLNGTSEFFINHPMHFSTLYEKVLKVVGSKNAWFKRYLNHNCTKPCTRERRKNEEWDIFVSSLSFIR